MKKKTLEIVKAPGSVVRKTDQPAVPRTRQVHKIRMLNLIQADIRLVDLRA